MTVEDERLAIAEACASINGWRASPYIRDAVAPPEMQVFRGPTVFDTSMGRESDERRYIIRAYVQRNSERSGQIRLDALLDNGQGSLKTVIEADAGVRAVVDFVRVRDASEVQQQEVGGVPYLYIDFDVEVG